MRIAKILVSIPAYNFYGTEEKIKSKACSR